MLPLAIQGTDPENLAHTFAFVAPPKKKSHYHAPKYMSKPRKESIEFSL